MERMRCIRINPRTGRALVYAVRVELEAKTGVRFKSRMSHTEGTEGQRGGKGGRTLMVSTQARGFFDHGFERMARITRMGEGMFL